MISVGGFCFVLFLEIRSLVFPKHCMRMSEGPSALWVISLLFYCLKMSIDTFSFTSISKEVPFGKKDAHRLNRDRQAPITDAFSGLSSAFLIASVNAPDMDPHGAVSTSVSPGSSALLRLLL